MRTRVIAPLAAALLLVGCGDDGDSTGTAQDRSTRPPPSSAPSPSPSPTGTAYATCVSTRAGLLVGYPASWTARDHPAGGCAYFDPRPFEVERATEAPPVAVRLDVERVPYERVREAYVSGEVLAQRQVTVAGYDGIRVEDRDTGGPLAPKGQRLTYLADLGSEKTLVLTTNETDAEDFDLAREVLDQMADRLERT